MINVVTERMPRGTLFLAFNGFVVLFLVLFVIAPVLGHFSSRSEEISESASQLARFHALARNAKALMKKAPQAGDPFLAGTEERVVSADLQASLKAMAAASGVRLLGIRGLPGSRYQQLRMVAVNVELEGPLPSVRNLFLAIENQMPFLFVTEASLRSAVDGDEGLIRAEIKVQGGLRQSGAPVGAMEETAQ